MENPATGSISTHQLDQILRGVEGAAVLAPQHILRRVIRLHTGAAGFLRKTPHRKSLVIAADAMLRYVDPEELDLPASHPFAGRVLMIQRPKPEKINTLPASQVLREYWRLLFHARIDAHMMARAEQGHLSPAVAVERIHDIGQAAFDEIRSVLAKERFLLPPTDNARVYSEFVAVYLELRYFLPHALEVYFPSIDSFERVDQVIARDVDGAALFAASKLPGAAMPGPLPPAMEPTPPPVKPKAKSAEDIRELDANYERLVRRADKAAAIGNDARAATTRNRAVHMRHPDDPPRVRNIVRPDIEKLAHRLCKVLDIDNGDELVHAMAQLLDPAAEGWGTPGARLLYDLQAVCIDHEKDIFKLDLVSWITSLGRVPIKRTLPAAKEVRLHQHLSKAVNRLHRALLPDEARTTLLRLLEPKLQIVEERVRMTLRPLIEQAVAESGLTPANRPEEIARQKLVEELLDRIVERGFISMGDLRDAVSRNQLKLPDVTREAFIKGDELLQTDKRLARLLDGVYRRGEVYRRWPQRMSSLAFGTKAGRFVTSYIAIPFLGAFLLLESLQHIVAMFVQAPPKIAGNALLVSTPGIEMPPPLPGRTGIQLNNPLSILLTGTVLLWLFHADRIRAALFKAIRWAFNRFYGIVIELPSEILRLEWVKRIVNNRAARLIYRYLLKPAFFGAVVWFLCHLWGLDWGFSLGYALLIFIVMNLLFNTPFGRGIEEAVGEWIGRVWRRFGWRVLVGAFQWIVDVFKWLLDAFEELLYNIDEWLRFRTGDNRAAFVGKLIVGTLWFFVSYLIVFTVTLLIEPQVNPIKHFPVVTVSHKVMLGLIPVISDILTPLFGDKTEATIFVSSIVWLIPGIFGYLAWELKENWRLYAANRPDNLKPIIIGHHGESMLGLLKPGFHSGTVPKLYGKLRKLERRRDWSPPGKAHRKLKLALHHVEHAVHRFVERDLVATLAASKTWGGLPLQVGHVHLGGNSVSIELFCQPHGASGPSTDAAPVHLVFEEQSGWLVASIHHGDCITRLDPVRRDVFQAALSGFYKHAAVDLVREQMEVTINVQRQPYDVSDHGIVVWPGGAADPVAFYPLHREPASTQADADASAITRVAHDILPLKPGQSPDLFRHFPIPWNQWVQTWEADHQGESAPTQQVPGPPLVRLSPLPK